MVSCFRQLKIVGKIDIKKYRTRYWLYRKTYRFSYAHQLRHRVRFPYPSPNCAIACFTASALGVG